MQRHDYRKVNTMFIFYIINVKCVYVCTFNEYKWRYTKVNTKVNSRSKYGMKRRLQMAVSFNLY